MNCAECALPCVAERALGAKFGKTARRTEKDAQPERYLSVAYITALML